MAHTFGSTVAIVGYKELRFVLDGLENTKPVGSGGRERVKGEGGSVPGLVRSTMRPPCSLHATQKIVDVRIAGHGASVKRQLTFFPAKKRAIPHSMAYIRWGT